MEKEIITFTLKSIQRISLKVLNKMQDKNKKGFLTIILPREAEDYIMRIISILGTYDLDASYSIQEVFKLPNERYVLNKLILKIRYEKRGDLENFLDEQF